MWYTGDNESNIKALKMKIWLIMKTSKKRWMRT
jgi:hypothetical protein